MPTTSAHLALVKPTTADGFSTAGIDTNWDLIDGFPGIFLCTSASRPTSWTTAHKGMLIYEADTDLYWQWTGTTWNRFKMRGWLNGSRRSSDLSTTSTTPATVVSTAVTIPNGGRRAQIAMSWGKVENTAGLTLLSLWRDTTVLHTWESPGYLAPTDPQDRGRGSSMVWYEAPGTGTYTYALKMAVDATVLGTSWVRASATSNCSIDVVEV